MGALKTRKCVVVTGRTIVVVTGTPSARQGEARNDRTERDAVQRGEAQSEVEVPVDNCATSLDVTLTSN